MHGEDYAKILPARPQMVITPGVGPFLGRPSTELDFKTLDNKAWVNQTNQSVIRI